MDEQHKIIGDLVKLAVPIDSLVPDPNNGIKSQGDMVTSAMRGVFLKEASARAEVLHLLDHG